MPFTRGILFLLASCILHPSIPLLAQPLLPLGDSLQAQSKRDSLTYVRPINALGSILATADSINVIERKSVRWGDYSYLGELLWQTPGAHIRDLGSSGQPSQLTFRGLGWHHIALLLDGRPVTEPLTGIANLNLFHLEAIQRIEYQTGVRSFLYGLNSTGGVVNIITQDYYTNRAYSRIRYSEGGYSFLSTDGVFAQNITQRLNFMGGFQRRTLDGRYPNSDYDAWNVRVKLKYFISDCVNMIVSELYNGTQVALNGGVDILKTPSLYVFDELRATVRNTDSYEKVHRHDLSATVGLRLFEDSSAISSATLFYSNNFRQYRDEENRQNANGVFIQSDHRSAWYGLKLSQELQKWGSQMSLGAELQERKITESPDVSPRRETSLSLTGKVETAIPGTTAGVFGRYDHFRGEDFVSYGADTKLEILPWLTGYAGYSTSYRTPTIQELYWKASGISRASSLQKEKHHLIEARLSAHASDVFELQATYFRRQIDNAIVATELLTANEIFPSVSLSNISEESLRGIDGKMSVKLWKFSGQGTFTYLLHNREEIEKRIYPKYYASGEISFRTPVFDGHLDLKVGVRGRFISSHYGEQYNPETMMYVENTIALLNQHGSADFFIVGKVGSAYIHLLFENVADEQYMLTPFFPMQDRKLRFGVEWEFLD